MQIFKTLTILLCASLLSAAAFAQTEGDDADSTSTDLKGGKRRHGREMHMGMSGEDAAPQTPRRWYLGNTFDGGIFSTAVFERPGARRELTTVRFSLLNFGTHFNYDFDEHFSFFTGLGIKNIGFIEKVGDSTIKRRVYTLGIPLGFKFGNLSKHHFVMLGGGIDAPFNYREKGFVKRNNKAKFNEWFSDRTENFMPYVFAGFSYGKGSTIKVQYYPGNFFNTEYQRTDNGVISNPYRGYSAHLLYISFGLDLHYKKPEKKAEEESAAPAEM